MLFDKLKADRIQALKDKDALKKDLLGTLIAEASKEVKVPDDATVRRTIKKFVENGKMVYDAIGETDVDALAKVSREIDILNAYLPKQMSADGIKAVVKYCLNLNNLPKEPKSLGAVMKFLKENYEGQYDGKLASTIVKEVLDGKLH